VCADKIGWKWTSEMSTTADKFSQNIGDKQKVKFRIQGDDHVLLTPMLHNYRSLLLLLPSSIEVEAVHRPSNLPRQASDIFFFFFSPELCQMVTLKALH
jgi:hypothetical protein